jgi:hypothetical protein
VEESLLDGNDHACTRRLHGVPIGMTKSIGKT